MNEAHENQCLELESYKTCSREAVNKGQASADFENASQREMVFFRRMLSLMSAVAVVAVLTAVSALFLALSAMKESQSIELKGIWKKVNANVEKTAELTNKLKNATDRLHQEDDALRAVLKEINSTFSIKVDSVRKLQGPIGPPGFNGSQGPIGPTGPPGFNGTQGPQGIMGPRGFNASQGSHGGADFSLCVHKTSSNTASQYKVTSNSPGAPTMVYLEEPSGKRIVGATCSSDLAQMYLLSTLINPTDGHLFYYCKCYGHYGTGWQYVECIMHYWECPLTT